MGWGSAPGFAIPRHERNTVMNLEMNYLDRTELTNDGPPGTYKDIPDSVLDSLITRASMIMRSKTRSAIYDVDEAGMPTEERIRFAFADATSAQVLAWVQGEVYEELVSAGATADALVSSSSNNGASVTLDNGERLAARRRLLAGELSTGARLILDDAGLLHGDPWLWM